MAATNLLRRSEGLQSSCATCGLFLCPRRPDTQTCCDQSPRSAGAPRFSVGKQARKLQMVSNTSKTWAGENVFPDLEGQLFHLTPTIVDGGDPMWKLKLVKREEAAIKNICSITEGYGLRGSSLTVYLL